jgi:ketosteroid isomerase-like protein
MSGNVVQRTIDVAALRAAIENGDADSLIGMYADDAEVKVMDKLHQPSHPLVFHGKDEVAGYWQDVCGRAMSHTVERIARDGDTVAYSEACRYPDGTRVQCLAFLDIKDGKIVRQFGIQTWDE